MSDTAGCLEFEFGPEIDKLSAALVAFQSQVGPVSKTKTARVRMKAGGEYTYDYADLADVIASTKDARTAAGLAVIQMPTGGDGEIVIVTTIVHTSGQWMRSSLKMRATDSSPQAIGSLITYGRRYSYSAALGICTEADDDGNAAQGHDASTKGRAEGKAPAPRVASATSAAGTSQPTTETAPNTSKASDIKHDGSKAAPDQIKLLHVLKGKLGVQECDGSCVRETVKVTKTKGQVPITVRCLYHTQLAKFIDQAGKPITSSKDLSIAQISHLLDSYHRKMEKMTEKTENLRPLDLEAQGHARDPGCDDEPPMADAGDLADLEDAARKRWGEGFAPKFNQWLAGAFDYDSVLQLHKDEAMDAVRMIGEGK